MSRVAKNPISIIKGGTVTGNAFGNRNCIRISYAASKEQIVEAVKRIKSAVES